MLLAVNFAQEQVSILQLNCSHCSTCLGLFCRNTGFTCEKSLVLPSTTLIFFLVIIFFLYCRNMSVVLMRFSIPVPPPFSLFVGFKMFLDSLWSFLILPDNFTYAHCPQKCQKTLSDYIQMIITKLPIMSGGKKFILPNI